MADKFTEVSQGILQAAQSEAIRRDHQELQPEHVFYASLEGETSIPEILSLVGVDPKAARAAAEELLRKLPRVLGGSGNL
jgi:ATP-dependent Clp protease ATP-binding subunit ClpB